MSTSEPNPATVSAGGAASRGGGRTMVAEVGGAAALTVALVALVSPADPWLRTVGFHPAWMVVIVFAARYGTHGLFASLALVWGGLIAVSALTVGSIDGMAARATSLSDLFALASATLVAWIAMLHEGRIDRAIQKLSAIAERGRAADETVEAMREVIGFLRARNDRIDMSVSLWRDLARRLERGEPADAAGAALELCVVRSGAASGTVHRWDGAHLHAVSWRGQSPSEDTPLDIPGDRTALAAIANRRPVLASEVPDCTTDDSDLAVPVLTESGATVIGVIALRGVAPGRLRAVDARDAAVVARWLSPSLAALAGPPRRQTGSENSR